MNTKLYTLITGASEGFGRALAVECARRKMNLLLVALPGSPLKELARFIEENFNVIVYTFEKDLTRTGDCYDLHLEICMLGCSVNVLINNAGIGSSFMFSEGAPEFFEKQIKLNVTAPTLITRLFLEQLTEHSKSYIMNVSSLSCFFYLPRKCVYGSTKSYLHYLSKTLRSELEHKGVSVTVVCPGGMNTTTHHTLMNTMGTWAAKKSSMNPEEVAVEAIDGLLKGKEVIIPGMLNKFFRALDFILPAVIKKVITKKQMNKLPTPVFNLQHQFINETLRRVI
ncbi:MAG TPA: SDR family NAD(P)-dependent oxidoreductase [Lacibacter sp.]|nr:SDR family NAD(P)-dependent oxidoreductase [Lacibacter sp.]